MSDSRLRKLERAAATGDLNAKQLFMGEQMRASVKLSWGRDPAVNCSMCLNGMVPIARGVCTGCNGNCPHDSHSVIYPAVIAEDAVKLKAFVGCGMSQDLLGWTDIGLCGCRGVCWHPNDADEDIDVDPLIPWAVSFSQLASKFPKILVEGVICESCQGTPNYCNGHLLPPYKCEDCTLSRGAICGCKVPGPQTREIPADRWFAVALVSAMGREVVKALRAIRPFPDEPMATWPTQHRQAVYAIDETELWTRCPCPPHLPDIGDVNMTRIYPGSERWWREAGPLCHGHLVPQLLGTALRSAARHIKIDRLRSTIKDTVLGILGG